MSITELGARPFRLGPFGSVPERLRKLQQNIRGAEALDAKRMQSRRIMVTCDWQLADGDHSQSLEEAVLG